MGAGRFMLPHESQSFREREKAQTGVKSGQSDISGGPTLDLQHAVRYCIEAPKGTTTSPPHAPLHHP